MASYDKDKLLALMEQRHAAQLSLADLTKRLREANTERDIARNKIQTNSDSARLADGSLNHLLALETDEALNLTADEVQIYTKQGSQYYSNINFSAYRQYILARDKARRLGETYESAQKDFNERFGIVSSLRDAVREWGFTDPELEM
ncbi:MAG: hypothetical protein Q7U78_03065 [Gallionella sp.]|nr:hypothetical protein [Gallionella sp.]